ncbi:MAG: RdgB/HAM1 family non-canonical purine NTP pyrophosphatase [Actinomycetota bacterium]
MTRRALTLATANPDKVVELQQLLGADWDISPRPADLADTVEDGDTLEANATKKGREVARHTGTLSVADDTGLFVDALGGRPGVWTARYAGPEATSADNVAKLLLELQGVTGDGRSAHFRTVIAAVWPDGTALTVDGRVDGVITERARGEAGFGYDPVFAPAEGDGRTFAEMSAQEKNEISHRGRAIQALQAELR